ncbi:MAG: hypothetical protein V7K50_27760 [Nostoc sp.]
MGHWALGTCTEFRHFGYAQCIATLSASLRSVHRYAQLPRSRSVS